MEMEQTNSDNDGYIEQDIIEQTKKCTGINGCGQEKPLSEFELRSDTGNYRGQCVSCRKKFLKQYRTDNHEDILLAKKEYREENKDSIYEYNKWYAETHKDEVRERQRNHQQDNRDNLNAARRERIKNDINFRIACNLRSRLWEIIKNGKKTGSAVRDLGCFVEYLMFRLESMFHINPKTGEIMSLDNYGFYGWHVDHIIPISFFDLEYREELLVACNYLNLQPMWSEQNHSKSDTLPDNFDALLLDIINSIPEIQDKPTLIAQLMQRKLDYIKGAVK
jgi:hypothetical protein